MDIMKSFAGCAVAVMACSCSSVGNLNENSNATGGGAGGTASDTVTVLSGSGQLTAKNYACGPISYYTIGNVLVANGVKLTLDELDPYAAANAGTGTGTGGGGGGGGGNATPTDSQVAYTAALSSFGLPDFPNRVPEATVVGTAQLSKLGDLMISSAPEIIANMGTSPRCGGVTLTDVNGHFTVDGLSCVSGQIATNDGYTLANQLVDQAVNQGMTPSQAQQLVLAGYLSALYTCR